jgi:flagellar motor protein MotB
MSLIHNQLQQAPSPDSEWHVKIADGSIYGPVDLATLRSWSSQGRIEPDNEISQDRKKWILAQDLRDLQMSWVAHLPDGTSYGPFNIHLLPDLKQNEVLPPGTELEHRYSGERHPVDDPEIETPSPAQTQSPQTKDRDLPLLALMGGSTGPAPQKAAAPAQPPAAAAPPVPQPPLAVEPTTEPSDQAPTTEVADEPPLVEETPAPEVTPEISPEVVPEVVEVSLEVALEASPEGDQASDPATPDKMHDDGLVNAPAPTPSVDATPAPAPDAAPTPVLEQPLDQPDHDPISAPPLLEEHDQTTTPPTEPILSGAVLAQRLEALQNSASLARSQLAAARKEIGEQKAYSSTLSDQSKKLEEELAAVSGSRMEAERGLVEATDRATMTESELENAHAQLGQLQEHYDRLQDESQRQFESLDSAQAELMRQEQLHKEELTVYDDRITSKTALLARTIRMILQDDDLDLGNVPEGLLVEDGERGEKELLLAELERLRGSGERDRRRITELSDKLADQTSTGSPSILRFIGGVVTIALLTAAIVLIGLRMGNNSATPPPPGPPLSQSLVPGAPRPTLAQPTAEPTDANAVTDGTTTAPTPGAPDLMPETVSRPSRTETPPDTWPEFAQPDAHILTEGNRLSIVYHYGIFETETRMVPQAERDLGLFAEQMRPYTGSFKVVAEGHTDATKITSSAGQYMDNYELGMARARKVRDLLVTQFGLPEGAVEVTSLGENSPLFPNDSDANRRLNRTVVLHVMPK